MDLREHLQNLSDAEKANLAKKSGTTPDYLVQLAGKHRNASPKLAQKIELATNGAVTKEDLRPDIWPPAEAAA